MIEQTWDHFLSYAVPTACMALIALSGGGAVLLCVYRIGYRRGYRRHVADSALARLENATAQTVPLPGSDR